MYQSNMTAVREGAAVLLIPRYSSSMSENPRSPGDFDRLYLGIPSYSHALIGGPLLLDSVPQGKPDAKGRVHVSYSYEYLCTWYCCTSRYLNWAPVHTRTRPGRSPTNLPPTPVRASALFKPYIRKRHACRLYLDYRYEYSLVVKQSYSRSLLYQR